MTAVVDMRSEQREQIMRRARRAWFWIGVRRGDRHRLVAELAAELAAAQADATMVDVLGDDPAATAEEWARARGVADRRLRLGVFLVPSLLAAIVVTGGLLAALADAFRGDGRSVLDLLGTSTASVLITYIVAGLLALGAIVVVVALLLRAVGDRSAERTVRALVRALPAGAVLAILGGVGVAALQGFTTRPRTFATVAAVVAVIVSCSIVLARWLAVHRSVAGSVAGPVSEVHGTPTEAI